jgi:hypothetical protein
MTEQAKVFTMDGVPKWMSRIAESGGMSIASIDGQIFATDGHIFVLAGTAPSGLLPLAETTRPKLGGVRGIMKEPDGATSKEIPLLALKTWCGPLRPTITCAVCDDEGATDCDICERSGVLAMECNVAGCRANHTDECCVCGGEGWNKCEDCLAIFAKRRYGNVGGVLVNMALVWSFAAHLEGESVRVVVEGKEKPLRFYGEGWLAGAMPMRATENQLETAKELNLQ